MKTSNSGIFKILIITSSVLITILLVTYIGLWFWIKSDINKYSESAMSMFPGDRVEALISVLKSETLSLSEKNHAIWTLEYVGDERALEVLKKLQTGTECNHNKYVCQRELQKAIGNIEGSNIVLVKFK